MEADIQRKVKLWGVIEAFRDGRLPDNVQIDNALAYAQQHSPVPLDKLSPDGRELVDDVRDIIGTMREMVAEKNGDEILQETVFRMENTDITHAKQSGVVPTNKKEALADRDEAGKHLRVLSTLFLTNGEMRKLVKDMGVIGRDMFATAAEKAAHAARPDEQLRSQVDQPAPKNTFISADGQVVGSDTTPELGMKAADGSSVRYNPKDPMSQAQVTGADGQTRTAGQAYSSYQDKKQDAKNQLAGAAQDASQNSSDPNNRNMAGLAAGVAGAGAAGAGTAAYLNRDKDGHNRQGVDPNTGRPYDNVPGQHDGTSRHLASGPTSRLGGDSAQPLGDRHTGTGLTGATGTHGTGTGLTGTHGTTGQRGLDNSEHHHGAGTALGAGAAGLGAGALAGHHLGKDQHQSSNPDFSSQGQGYDAARGVPAGGQQLTGSQHGVGALGNTHPGVTGHHNTDPTGISTSRGNDPTAATLPPGATHGGPTSRGLDDHSGHGMGTALGAGAAGLGAGALGAHAYNKDKDNRELAGHDVRLGTQQQGYAGDDRVPHSRTHDSSSRGLGSGTGHHTGLGGLGHHSSGQTGSAREVARDATGHGPTGSAARDLKDDATYGTTGSQLGDNRSGSHGYGTAAGVGAGAAALGAGGAALHHHNQDASRRTGATGDHTAGDVMRDATGRGPTGSAARDLKDDARYGTGANPTGTGLTSGTHTGTGLTSGTHTGTGVTSGTHTGTGTGLTGQHDARSGQHGLGTAAGAGAAGLGAGALASHALGSNDPARTGSHTTAGDVARDATGRGPTGSAARDLKDDAKYGTGANPTGAGLTSGSTGSGLTGSNTTGSGLTGSHPAGTGLTGSHPAGTGLTGQQDARSGSHGLGTAAGAGAAGLGAGALASHALGSGTHGSSGLEHGRDGLAISEAPTVGSDGKLGMDRAPGAGTGLGSTGTDFSSASTRQGTTGLETPDIPGSWPKDNTTTLGGGGGGLGSTATGTGAHGAGAGVTGSTGQNRAGVGAAAAGAAGAAGLGAGALAGHHGNQPGVVGGTGQPYPGPQGGAQRTATGATGATGTGTGAGVAGNRHSHTGSIGSMHSDHSLNVPLGYNPDQPDGSFLQPGQSPTSATGASAARGAAAPGSNISGRYPASRADDRFASGSDAARAAIAASQNQGVGGYSGDSGFDNQGRPVQHSAGGMASGHHTQAGGMTSGHTQSGGYNNQAGGYNNQAGGYDANYNNYGGQGQNQAGQQLASHAQDIDARRDPNASLGTQARQVKEGVQDKYQNDPDAQQAKDAGRARLNAIGNKIPEQHRQRVAEGWDTSRQIVQDAFPEERREQFIWRLKKVLLEVQEHKDYNEAMTWLLDALSKYKGYGEHVGQKGLQAGKEASSDPDASNVLDSFRTLLERFANGRSLQPTTQALNQLYRDSAQDPELKRWWTTVDNYVQAVLLEPGFVMEDDCDREGRELYNQGEFFFTKKYKSSWDNLWNEFTAWTKAFDEDPLNKRFGEDWKRLTKNLLFDGDGNLKFKSDLWADVRKVILPAMLQNIGYVPIPRAEYTDEKLDLVIENLILSGPNLFPNIVTLENHNFFKFSPYATIKDRSHHRLHLGMSQIQCDIRDVRFAFRKKSGFPRISDSGVADVILARNGISVDVIIETIEDRRDTCFRVRSVTTEIDQLSFKIRESKHDLLYKFIKAAATSAIKKAIAKAIEAAIRGALEHIDGQLTEVRNTMETAKQSDETTRKEALQNMYKRKKADAAAKKREVENERGKGEFRIVTDRDQQMLPEMTQSTKSSISNRIWKTEDAARSGKSWHSPAFAIAGDRHHPAVTGVSHPAATEGAGAGKSMTAAIGSKQEQATADARQSARKAERAADTAANV